MTTTLAIDPGKSMGWALFSGAALVRCGAFDGDYDAGMRTFGESSGLPPGFSYTDRIVCERPQYYPPTRGAKRVDPNDLITLALRAGAVVGSVRRLYPCVEVRWVLPATWKGSVPKPIHQRRIWEALTPAEQASARPAPAGPVAARRESPGWTDTLDAIGLGLYDLGRLRA